jgi:hypothetical protein
MAAQRFSKKTVSRFFLFLFRGAGGLSQPFSDIDEICRYCSLSPEKLSEAEDASRLPLTAEREILAALSQKYSGKPFLRKQYEEKAKEILGEDQRQLYRATRKLVVEEIARMPLPQDVKEWVLTDRRTLNLLTDFVHAASLCLKRDIPKKILNSLMVREFLNKVSTCTPT